jgi:hypothetical protein
MSESLLLSKGMKTAPLLNKNTGIVLRNVSKSYEMIVLRLRNEGEPTLLQIE